MPKTKVITSIALTVISLILAAPTVFALDTTAPVTTRVQTPSSPDGKNSWYTVPVKFDLSATDLESGVKEIWYRVDSGTWQKVSFSDALNLVQNPSFETAAATETGVDKWEATQADGAGNYAQDLSTFATGYDVASVRIEAPGGVWHGLNNKANFAVATPFQNMSASLWIKTDSVSTTKPASFDVYALNGSGDETLLTSSTTLSGTNNWTKLQANFVVNVADAVGVYIDVGFGGTGTIWVDAVSISSATTAAQTSVTVASDNANHRFEYYSVDNAANTETYSCTAPVKNCVNFKIDQTPPGNWHDSGAIRGLFGSSHELYVYTNVEDATSGLSVFTDKYQYHTDTQPGFGRYSNVLQCNSTWQADQWALLFTPPFSNGVESAYLVTQKTDFCNNDWKTCKIVRFYSEDMAGNSSTKDFCINGPWIKIRNKGVVRANQDISMLAESNTDNTDGLIEITGTSVDFFSTSTGWKAKEIASPAVYDYSKLNATIGNKTTISDGRLRTSSGVYLVNGNLNINTGAIPSGYGTSSFNQIYFINGDLKISNNVSVAAGSTALFIVKGKVEIAKAVTSVGVAIMADGDFYTAYDITEGETASTLTLNGLYSANKFVFQRTLQGTNNSDTPSDIFNYEPKYAIKLKDYFGAYNVSWKSIQ